MVEFMNSDLLMVKIDSILPKTNTHTHEHGIQKVNWKNDNFYKIHNEKLLCFFLDELVVVRPHQLLI